MWTDNETELDFLNFTGVADTVAEIVVQAQAQPISIGVSGCLGCREVVDDQVDPPIPRPAGEFGIYFR
jgi:hypothetical protein